MKKRVFITGASRGIGEATLYEFAKAGWDVRFSYYQDKHEAVQVGKKCSELGASSVRFFKLDVMKDADIKRIAKSVGEVDVLINNAGYLKYGSFRRHSFREIELECRTNFEGLVKLTHVMLPLVREQIVNVASRAGKIAHAGLVSYCGTKFGVRGFTIALADEVKRLKCFCVNPGLTATHMTRFEGVPVDKVGRVIFEAVVGERRVGSGGDVDVWKIVRGKKTREG